MIGVVIMLTLCVALLGLQNYRLVYELRERGVQIADVRNDDLTDLTENERMVLDRDASFDNRIARIKDELAGSQNAERKGTVADELHPDVKNLPHDIIRERDSLPDVEYTV